ncbi:MAG: NADH-quinone oxidoreductase subunit C [Deltaproteobacteria bacterium]|nr:NADH-quinone oxidoreductase subunit C [Deltaproteobacteria bacterium]
MDAPLDRLLARFEERVRVLPALAGQTAVEVAPADLVEVVAFLRDEAGFDVLLDLVGVDRLGHPEAPTPRFEVLYHLKSLAGGARVRVHVPVPDDTLELPSCWRLWHAANWLEREVWDLFGIRFAGHPNLCRILCHHRFEGHALRRDYPIGRRQRLDAPEAFLLTDDPEWA